MLLGRNFIHCKGASSTNHRIILFAVYHCTSYNSIRIVTNNKFRMKRKKKNAKGQRARAEIKMSIEECIYVQRQHWNMFYVLRMIKCIVSSFFPHFTYLHFDLIKALTSVKTKSYSLIFGIALRSSFDIESFRFNIFAIYRYSWRFRHSQIALTLSAAAAHIQVSKLFILKLRKYKKKKNETKTNWIKFAWCRMWFRLKRVQSRCSEMISMDLMLQKASNQFAKCENCEELL